MASISSVNLNEKLKTYRLTNEEFEKIRSLLGREPQGVEWALFSALWSEHCSYKSSKVHLKKLFNKSSKVVQSMGENAGVLDLGRGERIAFKIESHNHPSFIEPYQGAATGVGGIIRDILTMGARPIALANYLCFGDRKTKVEGECSSHHVDGVVRGIGGYGNCVGVAMVTGQTEFHSSYNKNILVNAFCLGYFGPDDTVVSSAAVLGSGNLVVYVGAKTGRDGIHGARMASESFNKEDESKRPNIQIGDPFFEKLLIESFLEVVEAGLVVCAQDMGAAGLISSTFEMASKGNVGFDLYLDKVPLRDPTMNPEEMLVSESQERMVLVCEPKNLAKVQNIFSKWGLDAVEIGKVIPKRVMRIHWKGEVISEIDPHALVENAPQWNRPVEETRPSIDTRYYLNTDAPEKKLLDAMSSLQGCGRSWIYEQYDQQVGTQTILDCRDSIGALRLPSGRSIGIALGGRPHMLRLNPFIGGADSLAEPALRLMSKGFIPVGASDCLNYGNPENPKIMGEFKNSLEGMSEAAKVFESPIVSGNVSFYNETGKQNITSTPAVSVIGLREDDKIPPHDYFSEEGLNLYLVRTLQVRTNGMWSVLSGEDLGGKGEIDFQTLKTYGQKLYDLSKSAQATKISGKFGLAYAIARMCVGCGAEVKAGLKKDDFFLERLYDFIFATRETWNSEKSAAYEIIPLGKTGGQKLRINEFIDIDVKVLRENYTGAWRKHFEELA